MKKFAFLVASAVALSASTSAYATDFSFTGNFATANDVQTFNFVVGAPSVVTLRTWSYAGGVNAAGANIARGGFDPILALFDSTGLRINQNDDGAGVAADAVTGAQFDTLLTSALVAGTYTVSIQAFSNFSIGPNFSNGFSGGGSFTDFTGNLRDNHWAFDILNVEGAVQGSVPEPATWAMMLLGFGIVGAGLRRKHRVSVSFV